MAQPIYNIKLDKPHQLRYSTNAIAALEATLGRPITSLVTEQVVDGQVVSVAYFGILELRAMLWAGLLWECKQNQKAPYSLEDVGDMLDDAPDYAAACKVVGEAVRGAMMGLQGEASEDAAGGK